MKPEDRKNEIVAAAIECFASLGYHATSISHIINKADIARGTFYLYFKSKHEIFQCILDEFISHLAMQIKTIDLAGSTSPAAQMRGNVERVVDAILSRPELSRILFNEAVGLDATTQERLKVFYGKLLTIIQSSVKRGISAGLVRNVNPEIAACLALGGIREIITQCHVFGNLQIKRETLIEGLIDVLFGGIGPKLLDE